MRRGAQRTCGPSAWRGCRGCAGCACRTHAALEVTRMSRFVHVTRGGDETGGDEPTPERRSSVRDHVVQRLQEPKGGGDLAFPQ